MVAHPSQEPGKGADRLDALTGMRGIASLMVVGYHAILFYWIWQLETGRVSNAFEHPLSVWGLGAGWLGVDFFFVLSGFLLARPLLRQAGAMTQLEYRAFVAKRVLRTAPPYYAALLLTYAVVGWSGHPLFDFTFEGVTAHVLYIHNFFPEHHFGIMGVAWTLGVELQFYLFLPLIMMPFRRFGPVATIPFALAAIAYLVWANAPVDASQVRFHTFQFPAFLGHFAVGIAAAQLVQGRWRPRIDPDFAIASALTLLVLVPASLLGYARQFEPVEGPLFAYFVRLLAGIFFGILMVFSLQPGSRVGRWFTMRPMVWMGEISYSLYLVHYGIAGTFLVSGSDAPFRDLPTFAFLLTVTSLIGAAAFYALVERPSLQLKEAVARRLGGVPRPRGLDPAP